MVLNIYCPLLLHDCVPWFTPVEKFRMSGLSSCSMYDDVEALKVDAVSHL
jgi:hypothetical protein